MPRDINERGRDLDQVLNQYMNYVKPAFEEFCSPVSSVFLNSKIQNRNLLNRLSISNHFTVESIQFKETNRNCFCLDYECYSQN